MLKLISGWLPQHFGHEVYVLNPDQIHGDEKLPKVDPWTSLSTGKNLMLFSLIGMAITASLATALYLKSKPFFQRIGQHIDRATYFAPDIIRVSLGASLIASAHFHAVFGPELPASLFSCSNLIEPFLYITGVALVVGLFSRLFGALVAIFYLLTFIDQGWYMLTYLNYFGEAVALLLITRQNLSIDALLFKPKKRQPSYERWAMPVARILFAFSLLYAAVNVKFITTALSLDVVQRYDLTHYFPFDPLFVVLGAGLVEILIAILYLAGLLQRVNSIAFMGFIILSLLFFKESVWPHYLLLGLAAGIFLHKPDHLALDAKLFRLKSKRA